MLIPLKDIAVIDRARSDMGDLQALALSIKTNGQISPIAVRPTRPGEVDETGVPITEKWVLVAGGRRYAAHILNNAEAIKAESMDEMSPLQHAIIELEENLARKQFEWPEEILAKERIHKLRQQENPQWTQKETAREIGEDPANVNRDLKLAAAIQANPELRAAPSKASAIRQIEYKAEIHRRLSNVSSANLMTLGQKMVTADMRDFVRTIQDKSIMLTFTDFPFGIEYNFEKHDQSKYKDTKGSLEDLLTDIVPQILRVTSDKGWLALMMGSTNYDYLKTLVQSCCRTHNEYRDQHEKSVDCYYPIAEDPEWIWYRPNSRNPSMWPDRHAQNAYEKVCVVNMGGARLIKTDVQNVLVHDAVYTDRIHEMQRPHSLCVDIIQRLTLTGETVLDLCFGSGSALAAAADLGRDFRGCDINPKNLEPAMTHVSKYLRANQ